MNRTLNIGVAIVITEFAAACTPSYDLPPPGGDSSPTRSQVVDPGHPATYVGPDVGTPVGSEGNQHNAA